MQKKIIFVFIICNLKLWANSPLLTVYYRDGEKLETKEVTYAEVGLAENSACFENDYVQVIEGAKEVTFNPITLVDDQECSNGVVRTDESSDHFHIEDKKKITLKTRAATAMYHIKIAREFMKDRLKKEELILDLDEKFVVRLNMDRNFDSNEHFHEIVVDKETGNPRVPIAGAYSVPKSGNYRSKDTLPWRHEMWFYRPVKKKLKSTMTLLGEQLDNPYVKGSLTKVFLLDDVVNATSGYARIRGAGITPDKFFYQFHGGNALISILVPQAIPKIFRASGQMWKRKVYLDIGVLPEIIYHEYIHYAFREPLPPASSAVQEGIANYFAYLISKLTTHGGKSKGMVKGIAVKKPKTNSLYTYEIDHKKKSKRLENSTGNFFYAVLYAYDKEISRHYPELFEKLLLRLISKDKDRDIYYLKKTIKINPFIDMFYTMMTDLVKKKTYKVNRKDKFTGVIKEVLFDDDVDDHLRSIIKRVNSEKGIK